MSFAVLCPSLFPSAVFSSQFLYHRCSMIHCRVLQPGSNCREIRMVCIATLSEALSNRWSLYADFWNYINTHNLSKYCKHTVNILHINSIKAVYCRFLNLLYMCQINTTQFVNMKVIRDCKLGVKTTADTSTRGMTGTSWIASGEPVIPKQTLSRLQLASANRVAALTSRDGILWVQGIPNVKNR